MIVFLILLSTFPLSYGSNEEYNCTNFNYLCCKNFNTSLTQLQKEEMNCINTSCSLPVNCSSNEIWYDIACCQNESKCTIFSIKDQCKLFKSTRNTISQNYPNITMQTSMDATTQTAINASTTKTGINATIQTSMDAITQTAIEASTIKNETNATIRIVSSTTSAFNHSTSERWNEDNLSEKSILTTNYSIQKATSTQILSSTDLLSKEMSSISWEREKMKNSDDKVKLTIVIAVPAASVILILLIGIVIFLLCRNRFMNKRRGKANGSMVYFNQETCHRISTIYDSIQISDSENDNSKYEEVDTSYNENHHQFPFSFVDEKKEKKEKDDSKPSNNENSESTSHKERF